MHIHTRSGETDVTHYNLKSLLIAGLMLSYQDIVYKIPDLGDPGIL